MSDGLVLQRIASDPQALPDYRRERDGKPVPEWVGRIMRASVQGWVPVITEEQVLAQRHRFAVAADLGSVLYVWRDDGHDVWTAVSVFLELDDEGNQILW